MISLWQQIALVVFGNVSVLATAPANKKGQAEMKAQTLRYTCFAA